MRLRSRRQITAAYIATKQSAAWFRLSSIPCSVLCVTLPIRNAKYTKHKHFQPLPALLIRCVPCPLPQLRHMGLPASVSCRRVTVQITG